jgi:hypothetical protein
VFTLVWLLGAPCWAEETDENPPAPSNEGKGIGLTSYWLLEEFDWGDDEEVVAESVMFDPHFACKGSETSACVLVSTVVDRERLLARFHHHQNELWQVVVLTPDLNRAQADLHLEGVWQLLVDYGVRQKGEPVVASPLPDLDSLEFGPPQLTHFWSLEDLELRVRVGRRDVDLFYVGLYFSDPVRGPAARGEHETRLAAADATRRRKRAEGAKGAPGKGKSN